LKFSVSIDRFVCLAYSIIDMLSRGTRIQRNQFIMTSRDSYIHWTSILNRWSFRRFTYGNLVTTSPSFR